MSRTERYLAWGRVHRHGHDVVRPTDAEAARVVLRTASVPALAYGRGRSYGDSCLNADGLLLDTGGLDRFIDFDSTTGLL
jgi:FAD/FMN-containing dehydrogenase